MPGSINYQAFYFLYQLGRVSLLLFLSFSKSDGQSSPQFDLITLEEGISNGFVTSMFEDDNGLLWMGTAAGLNSYDGYKFRSFLAYPEGSNKLSHPVIWTMEGDKKGNIWIGTEMGLNVFNLFTEQFTRYFHDPINAASISHNSIESLACDTAGNMWIGTANGLNIWLNDSTGFDRYFVNEELGIGSIVKALERDKAGTMWVGSLDTLYRHTNKRNFIPTALPLQKGVRRESNYIRTIYEDSYKRLWIGTEGNGVFVYHKGENEFIHHFFNDPVDGESLSHNMVTAVLEARNGDFWVSTYGGGLNIIKEESLKIRRFNSEIPNSLDVTVIRSMLADRAGNIWLGSSYEGLYISKKSKTPFRNYTAKNSGIIGNMVCSITEVSNGDIWIGTHGGGLHLFDPISDTFRNFQHQPENPNSLGSNYIKSVALGGNGDLWIADESGGLSRLDVENNQFYHLKPDLFGCGKWINFIFVDKSENVWLGRNNGLCKYESSSKQFITFELDSDPQIGDNRNIQHIFEDSRGNLWISTKGGLNLYTPIGNKLLYFPTPAPIYVVCEGDDGEIWLGTQRGLATFDRANEVFHFVEVDDMPSHTFSLFQDKSSGWWAGSPSGLYYYNPLTKETKLYNQKDGLINNQLLHAGLKMSNGEIFVAGISGFSRFNPEEVKQDINNLPVLITQFQLFNRQVPIRGSLGDSMKWSSPLLKSISYTKEINLKHWQNDFAFEFAAIDFTAPENISYQYKLEGYNENWIPTDSERRFAYYTNLQPGEYTFRVMASYHGSEWGELTNDVKLVVAYPWWKTFWALSLYVLLIISMFIGIFRFERSRRMARNEAQKQEEINHLQTKLYTNITHEFRTPLAIILGIVDQLNKESDKRLAENLMPIKRNGRQLLKLVNQMLDLSKLESGHLKLKLQQGDIINYLQYVIEFFQAYAESKDVYLHFLAKEKEFIMDFDPNKLLHVLSNLIYNAIKYSPGGGDVWISANLARENGILNRLFQIKVVDDGRGIPEKILPHIFDRFYQEDSTYSYDDEGSGIGLTLSWELVKLMGGTIEVNSKEGKGSEFVVSLPITNQANRKSIILQEKLISRDFYISSSVFFQI